MSTVPQLGSIVIDCADPDVLVAFWSEILDVGEARRFPGFVWLQAAAEGAPALAFQQVPERKQVKNRVHLDFEVEDREAFVAGVLELGGARVADHEIHGFHWTVLADPEGNEFCAAEH